MKDVAAVVFDADGTIFDTFELIVAAYRHVSVTHHLPVPEPLEIRRRLGSPMHEMFEAFYPGQDIQQLLDTNHAFVTQNLIQSEAFAGVKELLEELRARDMKLAILTSGTETVNDILEHHGLAEYFSSVVHTGRVNEPKPNPEGFLLACQECESDPSQTVMVGDTIFDIQTGKNGGALATIALTHGFGTKEDLVAAEPDYIAASILEVQNILITAGASNKLEDHTR
jgi:HAD superfamily hydrolase (TIGR01549 family)